MIVFKEQRTETSKYIFIVSTEKNGYCCYCSSIEKQLNWNIWLEKGEVKYMDIDGCRSNMDV